MNNVLEVETALKKPKSYQGKKNDILDFKCYTVFIKLQSIYFIYSNEEHYNCFTALKQSIDHTINHTL